MGRFFGALIDKYLKTSGPENEVDGIITVALLYQRIFAQQVLDPEWTWKKYFVHQLIIISMFVYVFFGTLERIRSTDDVDIVAESWYTFIMMGMFSLKILLFINNRFTLRELYVTVKTKLFAVIQADSNAQVDNVLKTGKRIVYLLISMVLIPCFIFELMVFWNYVNGKKILVSRGTVTLMPMSTPYFEIAWFIHSIFLFQISSTIILDMWFVLLVYFLCCASDSLAKILLVQSKDKNESRLSYSNRLNSSLETFYKIHTDHVQYTKALTNMYKWLAFVPLCNATMCVCLILLLMSKEINWKFAPNLMPMFAEIFVYNWFGEKLKNKAEDLHNNVINFDWANLKLKDKKNYYIIVTYMKKEVGIKTAIGYDLSLITMTTVLKVSYQTFTVLQSMNI